MNAVTRRLILALLPFLTFAPRALMAQEKIPVSVEARLDELQSQVNSLKTVIPRGSSEGAALFLYGAFAPSGLRTRGAILGCGYSPASSSVSSRFSSCSPRTQMTAEREAAHENCSLLSLPQRVNMRPTCLDMISGILHTANAGRVGSFGESS